MEQKFETKAHSDFRDAPIFIILYILFFSLITTLCPNVRKEIKLYLIQILVIYVNTENDTKANRRKRPIYGTFCDSMF